MLVTEYQLQIALLKGELVSRTLDLNSGHVFYRDKPVANTFSLLCLLSLVLFGLTIQPFEPLGKVSWKLLSFKTVFLLTLASSKGRSEIHVGIFFPYFKGELVTSGSGHFSQQSVDFGVKPVVMPALNHWDSTFTQDRSLCLLSVFKYFYRGQRDPMKLLFFTADIFRATISSG